MTTKPFRLLEHVEAGLTFYGREPKTLEELAIARADHAHVRRIAEINAIAKKLALLDKFLPELAARGVKLADRTINTPDGGETLIIQTPVLGLDDELYTALLALGFREVNRRNYGSYHVVTLKHNCSLLVAIDVTAEDEGMK